MKIVKFSAVWAMCILAMSACAVRTPVSPAPTTLSKADMKYEHVVFARFTASPNVLNPEGPLAECSASAMSCLRNKALFKGVEKQESDKSYDGPALLVEVTLTDLRIVGATARVLGGVFPGRSHMKVNVKLTDMDTGALVAEQELVGAPSAMGATWSFGARDRELPRQMGILLSDFVVSNARR